jgi:septum site-determining protein MinC
MTTTSAHLPHSQAPQQANSLQSAVPLPTLLIKQNLRSGQCINYAGNVVVIGHAHAGSEINAVGDINVWGELRGLAHAGMPSAEHPQGNRLAEVRALNIEALQLRIADTFARRPDRMTAHKLSITWTGTPEVARVIDGEIQVFSEIHDA